MNAETSDAKNLGGHPPLMAGAVVASDHLDLTITSQIDFTNVA
jgi:hypothetical protein